MPTPEEIIINDLYYFYRYFVASGYSNNIDAPHIKKLSRQLMKVCFSKNKRLVVNMPPQHSKTSMITLAFPLWLIMQDPNTKILIVNNSAGLSETFGIQIRDLVRRYGEKFGLFLSDDKQSNRYIMFANRDGENYSGSIRLVGAGASNITGTPVDYIIIDDPYSGFSDITPSALEKSIEWFKTIILQRLREASKLLILHTRWHSNDLSGYLQENYPNNYEFVVFPAIKENGKPLWDYYSIETLRKREEEMGTRLFEAIYQQNPLDETGDFFDIDRINFETDNYNQNTAHVISRCRSWDFAYTSDDPKKDSDYTAGAYMYLNYRNEIVLSDLVYGKFGDDLINQVRSTARRDGVNVPILMETGTTGNASEFLYKEYKKYLKGYNTKQSLPIGSKADRATPLKDLILDGNFRINIFNDELREDILKQFKAFPNGSHDDIIDAIAYGVQYLLNSGGTNTVGVSGLRNRKRLFRR